MKTSPDRNSHPKKKKLSKLIPFLIQTKKTLKTASPFSKSCCVPPFLSDQPRSDGRSRDWVAAPPKVGEGLPVLKWGRRRRRKYLPQPVDLPRDGCDRRSLARWLWQDTDGDSPRMGTDKNTGTGTSLLIKSSSSLTYPSTDLLI